MGITGSGAFWLLVLRLLGAATDPAVQCDESDPLREVAECREVVVGAQILDQTWETETQRAFVAREFNAATVGTFWRRTRPDSAPGSYDWSVTDRAVDWARSQGLKIHLHPLLFPSIHNVPQWVQDELATNPEDSLELLREHITTAMTHFKGRVDVWDVVNEAVDPSGGYRPSPWRDAIESIDGVENYVVEAYRIARSVDPDVVLLYNEHDIELSSSYQTNKWRRTQEILELLVAENLVDGLGWQLHTNPDEVLGEQFAVAERMQWVLGLGLKNYVTELDMEIGPGDEALQRQGEAFRKVTEVWAANSGGGWLQVWGVYDRFTFLGSDARPLLFDENYNPKPAYDGVKAALLALGPIPGDLNEDGQVNFGDVLYWFRSLR